MYRHHLLAVSMLLPVITLAACAQPAPPPEGLTEADRAMLREADAQWAAAANAKDFAAVGALYAEDARLLPPNAATVTGRGSIQAYFEEFPPFSNLELRPQDIGGCADAAYIVGTYSMMVTAPGAESPVPENGKYIEIFGKGTDGTWRIVRDIFNSDTALPAPEPVPTPET